LESKKQKILKSIKMANSTRKKIENTEKMGRPMVYGEKTETYSVAVPKSKKPIIKEFVENLLKTYRVKA
jgi:hypothetical protein